MTKDEALKLALEALEFMSHVDSIFANEFDFQINAIKEALAQPEQTPYITMPPSTPMWTIPAQRKPLTDEEIGAILEGVNAYGTRLYTFARAIEAAHNIKGEA